MGIQGCSRLLGSPPLTAPQHRSPSPLTVTPVGTQLQACRLQLSSSAWLTHSCHQGAPLSITQSSALAPHGGPARAASSRGTVSPFLLPIPLRPELRLRLLTSPTGCNPGIASGQGKQRLPFTRLPKPLSLAAAPWRSPHSAARTSEDVREEACHPLPCPPGARLPADREMKKWQPQFGEAAITRASAVSRGTPQKPAL